MTFKEKFKYYKRKSPPPKLDEVINMREPNADILSELSINADALEGGKEFKYGLKHPSLWKVYELKKCPGFIYILNPFTSAGQRFWITRSLADYTKKPSITNIDSHFDIKKILKHKNWWDVVSSNSEHGYSMKKKLRWATMGYHHNWDTKVYSESLKDPFPKDLNDLCMFVIKTVFNMDFKAEACIVNFYHMDSCLSGHTDHSEPNTEAPLISFSFGQTAIFLIGGTSLEECPQAISIESGDIAIMMDGSRLRYHGVPRILRSLNEPWSSFQNNSSVDQSIHIPELNCITYPITCRNLNDREFWIPFANYVKNARININVRQVLLPNQRAMNE